jgi:hypothetical protein
LELEYADSIGEPFEFDPIAAGVVWPDQGES